MKITVDILSRKIDEIIYDPYALLHRLDAESPDIVDKRDPNIPNIDVSLRRRLYLKATQLSRLFTHIDNLHHDNCFSTDAYPSHELLAILEKISTLYMFQIEPEIIELRLKLQPRNESEFEMHGRKHLGRLSENKDDARDHKYIHEPPYNPTFLMKEADDYNHAMYDEGRNPGHRILFTHGPTLPSNAAPPLESPDVRSSLYSQLVFTHSNLSAIHIKTLLPLIYSLKSLRRTVRGILREPDSRFKSVPDMIIETILNEYL